MAQRFDSEICVIGAGPSGSVVAKRLADLGHDVTIIESSVFPRSHVGICLSEETNPLLEYIGVTEQVKSAAFQQRRITAVKWETSEPVLTPQPGFHVDRGIFDKILLQSAVDSGATLIQPAFVRGLSRDEENCGWTVNLKTSGGIKQLSTRFIIDASGRNGVIPDKKIKVAPPLFSLHATWSLTRAPEYDGFIEAGNDSWVWFAQIKGERALVSVFLDPKDMAAGNGKLKTAYLDLLDQWSLLKSCPLHNMISSVTGCDATSRYSANPVSDSFICVGDAHFSVDPLASQGVHLAMVSSLQAAVVTNTLLRSPDKSEIAREFYKARQLERVTQFTERTAMAYGHAARRFDTSFWEQRSTDIKPLPPQQELLQTTPDTLQQITLSERVKICNMPIMQEEFITSSRALYHPSLNRPVAYVEGRELVKLLDDVRCGQTVESVVNGWTSKMPSDLAIRIISWLWSREILVPYTCAS